MAKLRFSQALLPALVVLSVPAGTLCGGAYAQAGTGHAGNSPKLERMTYKQARPIILGYGWKPFPPAACPMSVDGRACAQFPEIGSCSGVDPGYCGMTFSLGKRCLYVVTRGGPPEAGVETDTQVDSVAFRPAPCSNE
jgi:hypothetical protein